jgi:hypothetical protein
MLLDDLLVALRSAQSAAKGGIRCSIDPTPEGMARFNSVAKQVTKMNQQIIPAYEEAMGMQTIMVEGVPDTSHFARVLVAADYRMKRLGMAFDPAPAGVKLPSYLQMAPTGNVITPRFWLEPKYEPLLRDPEGLTWELRGASVRAMTEEDLFSASGSRQHTGKANPIAQKWCENMTDQYDKLAVADPIFGELRNCMELAIAGALIVKERLPEKAGYDLPVLLKSSELNPDIYPAPKQVPSRVSTLAISGKTKISVSGGVQINSWGIADKTQQSDAVAPVRAKSASADHSKWWWN